MLVLHLGSLDGQLVLWAEGTPSAPPAADALPFAADRKALAKALSAAALPTKLSAKSATRVAVWLPTRGTQPMASTPLIAEPPAGRAKVAVRPWEAPSP